MGFVKTIASQGKSRVNFRSDWDVGVSNPTREVTLATNFRQSLMNKTWPVLLFESETFLELS